MNHHVRLRSILGASLFALAMMAVAANAQQSPLGSPFGANPASGSGTYSPIVPVSAFARPWLDPSHFHVSSMISVGTGWSGSGTSALQVTSLAYQFTKPAWLSVSVGNSLGTPTFNGRNGMFLEGLTFGFKPWGNSIFQVQYRDMRSPLQYSSDPYYPFARRW